MNPFNYGKVVSHDDFCERPELMKQLISEIRRGQNVYVRGERRTGKTSLIIEAIRKNKKYRKVYIDLLEVKSLDDLIKRIVYAIVSARNETGFMEKMFNRLSHMRPVASLDPITGMPTLTISPGDKLTPDSIGGVIDLVFSLHTKSRPVVVVFDEFQDILKIDTHNEVLAILRSKVQFHKEIPYIFAGSVRNDIDTIFTSPKSPFFKSAIPIDVGSLEKKRFLDFLQTKFEEDARTVEPELMDQVFTIGANIPGDIQQLCGALWETSSSGDMLGKGAMIKALERIFAHEEKSYKITLKVITNQHLKVLSTLARISGKEPMSGNFQKESGIHQASSIRAALKRLIDLEILFYFEDEYRFVNPFFRAWIIYKRL